ncbi:MAG: heparan-alpha-glucosaminide N-acetyltransferase domain-containing protein [Rhodospirillales bacterium]
MMCLDVFRGLAVAGMVLVNNPGDDQSVYAQLLHSAWNGFSLADQVFPSFLFIVGASLAFSAVKDAGTRQFIRQVSWRSFVLFALGLMLNGFPYYHLHTLRVYGVLQRIGLIYGLSALAVRSLGRGGLWLLAVVILLGYWILLEFPGGAAAADPLSAQGNVVAMLDHLLLRPAHLYTIGTDPEGLLSTLPAVVTALIGYLAASWIREQPGTSATAAWLAAAGTAASLLGYLWSFWLPINKQLWTSSFTLLTAGICLIVFALLYQVIEIWRWRRWAQPLSMIGASALIIYIGCEIISVLLIQVPLALSIQQWILHQVFRPIAEPKQASLLYSLVELTCGPDWRSGCTNVGSPRPRQKV